MGPARGTIIYADWGLAVPDLRGLGEFSPWDQGKTQGPGTRVTWVRCHKCE
jgi:hypothetical protein